MGEAGCAEVVSTGFQGQAGTKWSQADLAHHVPCFAAVRRGILGGCHSLQSDTITRQADDYPMHTYIQMILCNYAIVWRSSPRPPGDVEFFFTV